MYKLEYASIIEPEFVKDTYYVLQFNSQCPFWHTKTKSIFLISTTLSSTDRICTSFKIAVLLQVVNPLGIFYFFCNVTISKLERSNFHLIHNLFNHTAPSNRQVKIYYRRYRLSVRFFFQYTNDIFYTTFLKFDTP